MPIQQILLFTVCLYVCILRDNTNFSAHLTSIQSIPIIFTLRLATEAPQKHKTAYRLHCGAILSHTHIFTHRTHSILPRWCTIISFFLPLEAMAALRGASFILHTKADTISLTKEDSAYLLARTTDHRLSGCRIYRICCFLAHATPLPHPVCLFLHLYYCTDTSFSGAHSAFVSIILSCVCDFILSDPFLNAAHSETHTQHNTLSHSSSAASTEHHLLSLLTHTPARTTHKTTPCSPSVRSTRRFYVLCCAELFVYINVAFLSRSFVCTLSTADTPSPTLFLSPSFASTFSKSDRNTYQLLLLSLCLISCSSLHTLIEKLLISSLF